LAACGGAPPAPGGPVSLNFLNENWGDMYNNLMTTISDEFTKANPNIKIDWNFDPEWTTKLTTLLAANTPPDATIMRPGPLSTIVSRGALAELGGRVQEAGYKPDDFIAAMYESCTLNGKLYAIPGGADYLCMYYNKDMMRRAGLDPEKPPATIDELLEQSQAVLKTSSSGDLERIGFVPQAKEFSNWAFLFGGQFYDAANRKITANDPRNVAALEWLANYVKLLDINKLAALTQIPGSGDINNPFPINKSAFTFDGFWAYETLDQQAPDMDYGVTFWPTMNGTEEDRKNYAISGWMYALPVGSPHPEEAWKFMRYAFIDESAKMGYMTLNGPCVKSQFDTWETGLRAKMGENNRMAQYLHFFTNTGAVATKYFPVVPVLGFYNDELSRVYDLVMRDETTAQAALDEVTRNVQAELDKIPA
jgi:ABC-type glycerol-3-phosphate transport system substrate-binding protein